MKKQLLFIGVLLSITFIAQAQDIFQSNVPSVIVNEFNNQFPKANDVEWKMEGILYRVDFKTGWSLDHEVWYTAEGKLVRHKEDIAASQLPKAVTDRLKKDFRDYSIDDAERINDNGTVVYKLELNALIQQDWDVVIDESGSVLTKIAD